MLVKVHQRQRKVGRVRALGIEACLTAVAPKRISFQNVCVDKSGLGLTRPARGTPVIVIAEKLRLNGHSLPFFSSVHRIQGSHGLLALNRRDVDSFHFHHISFSPHRIQLLIATQKYAPHPSLRLARATLLVIDRLTDHNSATSHNIL